MMFDKVIHFIYDNFSVILASLVSLISLVISITKTKKNNKLVVVSSAISMLPYFINEAESAGFNSGTTKFKYVFQLVVNYISTHLGMSSEDVVSIYGLTIEANIENILSTPQKKEVSVDVKKKES